MAAKKPPFRFGAPKGGLPEALTAMSKKRGALPGMDKPADTPAMEAAERKRGIRT